MAQTASPTFRIETDARTLDEWERHPTSENTYWNRNRRTLTLTLHREEASDKPYRLVFAGEACSAQYKSLDEARTAAYETMQSISSTRGKFRDAIEVLSDVCTELLKRHCPPPENADINGVVSELGPSGYSVTPYQGHPPKQTPIDTLAEADILSVHVPVDGPSAGVSYQGRMVDDGGGKTFQRKPENPEVLERDIDAALGAAGLNTITTPRRTSYTTNGRAIHYRAFTSVPTDLVESEPSVQ